MIGLPRLRYGRWTAGSVLWQNAAILDRGGAGGGVVANDEHLALLRQGTAIWNEWRARNPDSRPDLFEADLSSADLTWANLTRAGLIGANLANANLFGANLGDANLTRANLRDANLTRAHLIKAKFRGANLSGADLSGANLIAADLTNADLTAAILRWASLTKARLTDADLTGAYLFETIFAAVDLTQTNGLTECKHVGPSVIEFRTLLRSTNLPISFLRGCGVADNVMEYLPSFRGDPIRFYSCFISYSAKDQGFAERLHADLQNNGVGCWFAPHDLPIGAKTRDAIDEAIRLRDKLLLILSKASIDSEWVEDEVTKAFAEERYRKEVVLFPIRIDNAVMSTSEPWAVKLRDQRNIGDFRQWRRPAEYQNSLEGLLRDLNASGAK